jgi:spore coat polysaccharide biosynthesis protein SpsF
MVSVRCTSSRLPNKAIMKIKNDLRSIDIVIRRAKLIGPSVILATSTDKSDDVLVEIAKNNQIEIFRGALENKIKRWHDCFTEFEIDTAIEIDGDDLCYNYDMGKRALKEIQSNDMELLIAPPDTITGLFTYAITRSAITKLHDVAQSVETNTDVITKFIEKANLKIDYVSTMEFERNKKIRLTLDYEEDLQFFRELYDKVDILTSSERVIEYLQKHPKLSKINYQRQQDYLNNQAKFNAQIK